MDYYVAADLYKKWLTGEIQLNWNTVYQLERRLYDGEYQLTTTSAERESDDTQGEALQTEQRKRNAKVKPIYKHKGK